MASIFLQLGEFRFKCEALEKITNSSADQSLQDAIDAFYQQGNTSLNHCANFLIQLVPMVKTKESKDKLLIALVYFIVHDEITNEEALALLGKVLALNEPVVRKVKLFSFVFKSTSNGVLKKWVLKNTVSCIQNEPKISYYAGFIEHFDVLIESLDLTKEEVVEIYAKLISYLEKHPVYKKLCSEYVIKSLQKVTSSISQSKETSSLILKAIKYGNISDSALSLLTHEPLHSNQNYALLEVLLKGDFEKLDVNEIKKFEKDGVVGAEVLRKMKIESIPRLLSNIKVASYDQIAKVLQIEKVEVQFYIIDAIKEGILKAKLDQFSETVLITSINFRALRMEERVKLQKDITEICKKLTENANIPSQ